jgi:Holliday junction resolvase-like predicted endonuclease
MLGGGKVISKEGELVEQFMVDWFIDKGFAVQSVNKRPRKYWYEYDFLAEKDGTIKTYEVKNDIASGTYGNIAIEIAQGKTDKKPSGIMTSKSDYWVHFVYGWNHYFIVETPLLRHWMMQMVLDNAEYRIHQNGGDNRNDIMLIPVKQLLKQIEIWGKKVAVKKIPDFILTEFRGVSC